MNLRELIPVMRELGVIRATFSTRGDVLSAELLSDASEVVPLPPLDAAPIEVGETAAPPEPDRTPPPARAHDPHPMDAGEEMAMTRADEKRQREKAAARARAYEDSILFAASGYVPPSPMITENDENL